MNLIGKIKILSLINWFAVILFPILFYFLLIFYYPVIYLPKILIDRSIVGFLSILVLYGLSFRLQGKSGWFVSLTITVLLFVAPLLNMLHTGYSNTAVIASFLPYKDGFNYYNGARTLLSGYPIAYGWNDIFRPLFPGILAFCLSITGNNLLLSLSMINLSMGFGCLMAAKQTNEVFDSWPAALFMALMTIYSRRFVGYTWTEIPGVFLGCISFILLLRGAKNHKLFDISLGAIILVLALSTRAGAFVILPFIALWAGFSFKKTKQYNLKSFAVVSVSIFIVFMMANYVIPRVLTASGNTTFGNFAYTLYGQAKGGAGWHQSIEELQTADTTYIMQEAIKLILRYPLGIIIGTVKAFRDFFTPNINGIFNLINTKSIGLNIFFWASNTVLMILGIIYCIRSVRKPIFSLILICLIGLLFSIPFVPPISNGNRLYAGSIPFFFVIPVIGLMRLIKRNTLNRIEPEIKDGAANMYLRAFSIGLIILVLIPPILIKTLGKPPNYQQIKCPDSQIPFAIQIYNGGFVDISNNKNINCGNNSKLCLTDFEKNGADKKNDDFFQILVKMAKSSNNGLRITESVDLISSRYHFFIGPPDLLPTENPKELVTGCATNIENKYQPALWVVSN
jgi:hypothetical protein